MSGTPRVFVSHSHHDNEVTDRVVADLRAAGADVWIDTAEIVHDDFQERINVGLTDRDWLILIETPDALHSPWVRKEVNAALQLKDQGRLRDVIPLVVKPCVPTEVPPLWAILHHYDATVDYQRAIQGLLRAMGLGGGTATGPVAPSRPAASPIPAASPMPGPSPMPPGTAAAFPYTAPPQAPVYAPPYSPTPPGYTNPQPARPVNQAPSPYPVASAPSPYPALVPRARKLSAGWIVAIVVGVVLLMCFCVSILIAAAENSHSSYPASVSPYVASIGTSTLAVLARFTIRT